MHTARDINLWNDLIPADATVARQHYRLASVKCDMPLLMLPLAGFKRVHFGQEIFASGRGEFLMLHGAIDVSVENVPAETLPYKAWIIGFPWPLIELTRQLILNGRASALAGTTQHVITQGTVSQSLFDKLFRHLQLLSGAPSAAEIDLSLMQILVALHGENASGFLYASDPSLSSRIRIMVSAQPQRDWSSADFENELHVSGATLRRRLAQENTSLRLLIREARLHVALTLLQTSNKPIKAVAALSGFQSLSSFRENFIEQFGVSPTDVANY